MGSSGGGGLLSTTSLGDTPSWGGAGLVFGPSKIILDVFGHFVRETSGNFGHGHIAKILNFFRASRFHSNAQPEPAVVRCPVVLRKDYIKELQLYFFHLMVAD